MLAIAATSGGLFRVASWAQLGVLGGIIAGLIAASIMDAGIAAVVGSVVGLVLGPPNVFAAADVTMGETVGVLAVATLVAIGSRFVVGWRWRWALPLAWVAVGVVIANLWATTLAVNAMPTYDPLLRTNAPPLNQQIEGAVPEGYEEDDHFFFRNVARDVADGDSFYRAFRNRFVEWAGVAPSQLSNVRSAGAFYLWSLFPGTSVVVAFLVLATVAIVAAVLGASAVVRLPLALPVAGALASYFLFFSLQMQLFTGEAWGVCFALIGFAAYAWSLGHTRWKALVVVAAVLAVCAALVRETLVFVPVAGAAAALLAPTAERRFRLAVAAGALVAVAVVLGAHYLAARALLDPASGYEQFTRAGFGNAYSALVFGTGYLSRTVGLPSLLAALGLVGVVVAPVRHLRGYLAVCTLLPLVSFLFVSNTAVETVSGAAHNYWGTMVVPMLYAAMPLALAWVPGAARPLSTGLAARAAGPGAEARVVRRTG